MQSIIESKHVSFGLVIEANNSISDLQKTVRSIKGICYPLSKMKVVISCKNEALSSQQLLNELEEIKQHGIMGNVVIHFVEDTPEVMDTDTFDSLMRSHMDYLIKIDAGYQIDNDFFNFINSNQSANYSVFEDEENKIIAMSYNTVNNAYLDYRDYDLMVKHIPTLKNEKTYLKYDKKN
jgi:hypothetical protein